MEPPGKVVPPQLDAAALRDIVDVAFDALVITRKGQIVFANRSFVEMSGWDEDEILGRSVLDFVAPECHAFVLERMKNPNDHRYEAVAVQRDGTHLDVEITAGVITYLGEPARISAIRYISERKEAELRLRRSEARLRQLIERMTDMIVVHRNGAILFANPAALSYLGYEALDALVGKPISDLLHPADQSASAAQPELTTDARANALTTVRALRGDGTTGLLEVATTLIDDFDGAPAVLVLGRDVTERKKMETRLVQADLLASMGTLAAGIAHEINNPLAYMTINLDVMRRAIRELGTVVRGESTCAARAGALVAELDQLLAVAREGAERVRHIVRDFRVFARGGSEARRPIDIQRVLDSTIKIAFNDIRHRARLVRTHDPVPLVDADEPRLGQLFLNVLVNALQALDDTNADRNEIRVATRTAPDGSAVVEIADTGTGIPPDVLGRAFEPFFSTKPIGVGTGLGLPICQSIVSSLRGTIALESEVGHGTTCRITLPPLARQLTESDASGSERLAAAFAADEAETQCVGRSRVLIVDDEAPLLRALEQELGREHDVTCTESASEAIRLILSQPFDIVLCDLMMPSVSGIDVYEAVRRERPGLERQLVFMTAGAFTATARAFLQSVPNPKLEKPFTWSELRKVVRELQRDRSEGR